LYRSLGSTNFFICSDELSNPGFSTDMSIDVSAVIIGGVEVVGRESEEIKFLLFG